MQYTPAILSVSNLISMGLLVPLNTLMGYNPLYPMVLMIVCLLYVLLDAIFTHADGAVQTVIMLLMGTGASIALLWYGVASGDQSIYGLAVPILFVGINIYLLRESFLYG